jgi:ankyrin repeat protein
LIAHGADVNAENKRFKTPLAIALQSDNETIINILLDNGAKLESKGGAVTFEDAIDRTSLSLVKYFLKQGININDELKNGETPLAKAIGKESIELVKLLIENGADVNQACGRDSDTPLHYALYAIDQNKVKEMVKFLVKKGAYVNKTNSQGEKPIVLAEDFFGESSVITQILYSPGAKRI